MTLAVTSDVAGTVIEIGITAGQVVATDECLCLVESMKMEIPIVSPVKGKILEYRVAVGDVLATGAVIAILEVEGC